MSSETSSPASASPPSPSPSPPAARPPAPPEPAHHCFICLVDSGEPDDPQDWVHPSPCALEAHHACLIKWMDESDPTGNKPLECPQCKAPIRATMKRDSVVEASSNLQRAMNKMAPVFVPLSISATFLAGQAWYGQMAAGLFFDGRFPDTVEISFVNPGSFMKHAMIMPSLLSFHIFPNVTTHLMGPLSTFYLSTKLGQVWDAGWPPDPTIAFAMIPCLAGAYKTIRNKIFGRLETGWDRIIYGEVEVQNPPPERRGLAGMLGGIIEDLGGGPLNQPGLQEENDVEVENVIEVRVVADGEDMLDDAPLVLEMDIEEEQQPQEPAVPEAAPQNGGGQEQGQQQNNGQQANNRRVAPRAARFSLTRLLIQVSVALAFPSISFTCGELLRLVLPKSATSGRGTLAYSPSARGLLHTTWGRSFVGGAMFLVVNDMFQLYVKYRLASVKTLRRIPNVPRGRNA